MRNCPSCGQAIPDGDSVFCHKCGEKLFVPSAINPGDQTETKITENEVQGTLGQMEQAAALNVPNSMESSKFCTNCGKKLDSTDKFCTGCGTPAGGHQQPITGSVNQLPQKKKKNLYIGVAAVVAIIAGIMIHSANSPFNKVKGYWYTLKYQSYMTVEPVGDKMLNLALYDESGQPEQVHGTVLSHTSNSIEIRVNDDGDISIATLELKDKSHLSLIVKDESGDVEESLDFEKQTKSDFDKRNSNQK